MCACYTVTLSYSTCRYAMLLRELLLCWGVEGRRRAKDNGILIGIAMHNDFGLVKKNVCMVISNNSDSLRMDDSFLSLLYLIHLIHRFLWTLHQDCDSVASRDTSAGVWASQKIHPKNLKFGWIFRCFLVDSYSAPPILFCSFDGVFRVCKAIMNSGIGSNKCFLCCFGGC